MSGDFFRENWLFLFTMIFTIKADAELSKCDFVMMGFLKRRPSPEFSTAFPVKKIFRESRPFWDTMILGNELFTQERKNERKKLLCQEKGFAAGFM